MLKARHHRSSVRLSPAAVDRMGAATRRPLPLLLLLLVASSVPAGLCDTNAQDGQSDQRSKTFCFFPFFSSLVTNLVCAMGPASALRSMMGQWTNYPSTWTPSGDPCDGSWDGIMCSGGRITSL